MSCNLVCTQINSIYFIIYSFQLIHISRTWIILPKIVGCLKKPKKAVFIFVVFASCCWFNKKPANTVFIYVKKLIFTVFKDI